MMNCEYRGLTNTGVWEYGGINEKHNLIIRGFTFLTILPETASKNTYCCDINGKYAFEGDIVRVTTSKTLQIVSYFPSHASFGLKPYDTEDEWYPLIDGQFEIMGNIFENKEMLSNV